MNKNLKTTLNTILFLGLGIALFYWATSEVGMDNIIEDIKNADILYIVLAMICGVLSHLARALRWNLLLEPMGYKASAAGSFHSVIVGYLVNMAVPRLGEVTRPAMLSRLEGIPFNKLIGTVLVERVVDLIITLLITITIFFLQFKLISDFVFELFDGSSSTDYMIMGAIALGVLIAFGLAIYYRKYIYQLPIISKFKSFFEGIIDGLKTIFKLKRKGLFIAYSLLIWVMYFFMPFLVFFALEGTSHLGFSAGMTVLLFGTIAMIIPVPGGLGTFEILVPAALVLYGISEQVGDTYAILTHAVQVLLIFIVGVFSVIYFVVKDRKNKNELEQTNS